MRRKFDTELNLSEVISFTDGWTSRSAVEFQIITCTTFSLSFQPSSDYSEVTLDITCEIKCFKKSNWIKHEKYQM